MQYNAMYVIIVLIFNLINIHYFIADVITLNGLS